MPSSYGSPYSSSSSSSSSSRTPRLSIGKIAGGALFALLFIVILGISGCTTIAPGNVGIEISKVGASRGPQDMPTKSGFVLYNPLTTEVVEYPTFVQTVKWTKSPSEGNPSDESITFTTNEGTQVNADVSLSYQLDYDHAPAFYAKYRADKIDRFTDSNLRNEVRNQFNDIAGKYSVDQVMSDNGPILVLVEKAVQEKFRADGITISQLGFIGAPRPPQGIIDAMNYKVHAEQIAKAKVSELAQSEADAKKLEARAEGEAQANIIGAKGEAEANRLRGEALSPSLIELEKIRKWDGHNPNVVNGTAGGLIVSTK